MAFRFGQFAKAEDGNAVIDWLVLTTGVALMTVSLVLTITPGVNTVTTESPERAAPIEDVRPV